MKRISLLTISIFILSAFLFEFSAASVRLKDIASLKGVRENQLIGYGLVVGLDGSGDGTSNLFTTQSMATMLNNLDVGVDPDSVRLQNVAAVIVTADLPPFARQGSKVEVTVSSLGDASSLKGGTLLLTPLKGADGEVYAIAQGSVSVGGFSQEAGGAQESQNHPTVGRVPNGATVERELSFDFSNINELTYSLKEADFTTAQRAVSVLNQELGGEYARAQDSATLRLRIPESYQNRVVDLVANVESLRLQPDRHARIVVNERTGTVVVGEDVKISTVAIAHGNLTISIQPNVAVSQPESLSDGETVVTQDPTINVQEEDDQLAMIPGGISIGDLVKALNAIGITPRDLIAVFQAIKASGALQAELEII